MCAVLNTTRTRTGTSNMVQLHRPRVYDEGEILVSICQLLWRFFTLSTVGQSGKNQEAVVRPATASVIIGNVFGKDEPVATSTLDRILR